MRHPVYCIVSFPFVHYNSDADASKYLFPNLHRNINIHRNTDKQAKTEHFATEKCFRHLSTSKNRRAYKRIFTQANLPQIIITVSFGLFRQGITCTFIKNQGDSIVSDTKIGLVCLLRKQQIRSTILCMPLQTVGNSNFFIWRKISIPLS